MTNEERLMFMALRVVFVLFSLAMFFFVLL